MNSASDELRYTKSHEWVRRLDDGSLEVGITGHAQELMGDMVYVDLPEVGTEVSAGDECGAVESVKAASEVYAPVGGEIVAVNEALADSPETVNQDPEGAGWLFRIRPGDPSEFDALLDGAAYRALVESESD